MPDCTILTDAQVHEILINLPKNDVQYFTGKIERCIQDFSTTKERTYQPDVGIVNRPNGQKTLFRPFTSPSGVGTKIIVDPAPDADGNKSALHGVLVICDNQGLPKGMINAEEVTGYRTSLSAIIPFLRRRYTDSIVIFGAGKQALWHARLALALRGDEIQSLTVINRTEPRAREIVQQLQKENNERGWSSKAEIRVLSQASEGYHDALAKLLSEADVVFCTVPSQQPLFSAGLLTESRTGSKRQPLVTAIGSWQPDMIELDPELLHHVRDDRQAYNPGGKIGGVVVVDDCEGALQHAGEVVQSKLGSAHLIELGSLLALQQELQTHGDGTKCEELDAWLAEGLVLYKSIGVSVTDLIAGEVILSMAAKCGVGTSISNL